MDNTVYPGAVTLRRDGSLNREYAIVNVEARIIALEERLAELEAEVKANRPKLDNVLKAILDMHDDLRKFRADLPDIIARSVAPLLRQ